MVTDQKFDQLRAEFNMHVKRMSDIWPPRKRHADSSVGAGQYVDLTSAGSSPSFTYSFTDNTSAAFSAITPANSADRTGADILAATGGIWFPDGTGSGDLYVIEPPDLSTCSDSLDTMDDADMRMMTWMGF